jgi:predicted nucleotidyltransferase
LEIKQLVATSIPEHFSKHHEHNRWMIDTQASFITPTNQPTLHTMATAPTTESVFTALKIPPAKVVGVFLVGSRCWGTHRAGSDYDFIIVTSGLPQKGALHARNINAKLLDVAEYRERIRMHRLLELTTLFVPRDNIWLNRIQPAATLHVDRLVLIESLEHECHKDWERVCKLLMANDLVAAKKTFVCAVRNCLLAKQLLEHNRIVDLQCANDFRLELMAEYQSDREHWQATYGEYLNDLQLQVRQLAQPH